MSGSVGRLLRAALVASVIAASNTVPASAASAPPVSARALSSDTQSLGVPAGLTPSPSVTARSMARSTLILVNRARAARGLRALVLDSRLATAAFERAAWMAVHNLMTHTSAHGSVINAVRAHGVRASRAGECVGWTNAPWGYAAYRYLFSAWKQSPGHWDLLMSPLFTRVGIGFAYRSANAYTYGSLVLARL
jgi:uncharacterized protein YkwD